MRGSFAPPGPPGIITGKSVLLAGQASLCHTNPILFGHLRSHNHKLCCAVHAVENPDWRLLLSCCSLAVRRSAAQWLQSSVLILADKS